MSITMAALSSAKRLARIGWWLGLSMAAMLAAACGAMFASACKSSPASKDGGPADATGGVEHIGIVIPPIDAGAPTDASETDLWNTICE